MPCEGDADEEAVGERGAAEERVAVGYALFPVVSVRNLRRKYAVG